MRKTKEVLRLRFELGLGLGQRAIARACSISQSTVHVQRHLALWKTFRGIAIIIPTIVIN